MQSHYLTNNESMQLLQASRVQHVIVVGTHKVAVYMIIV